MRARLELLEAAVLARGTGVPRARRRSPKVSLQDEDSVEDEDEDEDERTVGGTPVVEACADACEESAPSSMMEVFGQEVAESVYGRAVGSSLALALELGAGSFARRAHVSVQLAGSVLLIVGQIVTCLSVPSAAEFLAQAGDDDAWMRKFAPTGSDDPHIFARAYEVTIHGFPLVTLITIVFCYVNLSGDLVAELRGVVSATAMAMSIALLDPGAVRSPWYVCAACFTNLRMIMILVYAYAVAWLLGRSDGPADVVLNSLSLSFIITADDVVSRLLTSTWKQLSATSVEDLRAVNDMTRRAASAAESHAGFRAKMEYMVWAYYAIVSVFCLVPLVQIQYNTGKGALVGEGAESLMPTSFYNKLDHEASLSAVAACVFLKMTMHFLITIEELKFKDWSRLKMATYLLKIDLFQLAFTAGALYAVYVIRFELLQDSLDLLTTFGEKPDDPPKVAEEPPALATSQPTYSY